MPRLQHVSMIVSAVVMTAAAIGCSRTALGGSGHVITESRAVSGFHAIELSGVGQLILDQSGTESLSIEAEDNLLPKLSSTVDGGVLHLGSKDFMVDLQPTRAIVYHLTVKQIDRLEIAGDETVTGTHLQTGDLTVRLAGAGDVSLSGHAGQQTVAVIGAGRYDAERLATDTTSIQIIGSGTATVDAAKTLNVDITGAGKVEYLGNPTIEQNVIGAGSVRRHDGS